MISDSIVTRSLRLPAPLDARLVEAAHTQGVSINVWIKAAILFALANQPLAEKGK